MNPNNTKDELKSLNSGLPDNSPNPFSVPEGYFEGLAANVLSKIKVNSETAADEITQLSPLLAGLSRKMPYQLPENFFETNISNIPYLIQDDPKSSMLEYIGKEMPFSLPVGYFENLTIQILKRLPTNTRVIPMRRTNWLRLATAAMVAGIIGMAGIGYFNHGTSKDPIITIKKSSNGDLDAFLKNTNATLLNSETAQNQNQAARTDIKEMIKDVPENEVDDFLNQVPNEDAEPLTN